MKLTYAYWLHPVLFALYPVLHVYGQNAWELEPFDLVRPALVTGVLAFALAASLQWLRKTPHTAGLAASLIIIAFYTGWGSLFRPMVYGTGESLGIGVRYVFALYAVVIVALVAVLLWRRWGVERDTRVLNCTAAFLFVMASITFGNAYSKTQHNLDGLPVVPVPDALADAAATQQPDLYFIVLDAYGRADVLQEVFGFDNAPFLDAMRARSFHEVARAHTPYEWTNQSLPACVNMQYLATLRQQIPDFDKINPRRVYRDAVLHRVLRNQGYHLAATETRDPLSDPDERFDTILRYQPGALGMTRFELVLLDLTPLPKILRLLGVHPGYGLWRDRILHTLENLHVPAEDQEAPVYMQAHIICPHRPFVFDAEGNAANPDTAFSLTARPGMDPPFEVLARQYINQVQGLNRHVLDAVDRILETADTPPVIAIVSDHGPPLQSEYGAGRQATLMLIHTPDGAAPPDDLNLVALWPWILRTQLGLPAEDPAPPT